MSIALIGLNHKTAPVEIREKVSLSKPQISKYSLSIRGKRSYDGCAILSTCNRTEFYCSTSNIDLAIEDVMKMVESHSGISLDILKSYIYIKRNRDAVQHLFSVSAGLDSMILGESQIQGQVQDAYEIALNENLSNNIINTLFMNALTVGKRVRTETQIDRQAISISSAAVELAQAFFGDISDKNVLVLGAGETSELTSRNLVSKGISSIIVSNRTFNRAQWLAEEVGGQAVHIEDFPDIIPQADIVISSTASPKFFLTVNDLKKYLPLRSKPLLIIDIAVPRDIEPEVGKLPHVTLYDIDDLQNIVHKNLESRKAESICAKHIIEEELDDFYFWLESLWVIPTIVRMREQVEQIKNREIQRAKNRIENITPREENIIESMANNIVNQWLHIPMTNMKSLAGRRVDQMDCYIRAIQDLWGLEICRDHEKEM